MSKEGPKFDVERAIEDELDHLIGCAQALRYRTMRPSTSNGEVTLDQVHAQINRMRESVERIDAWTPKTEDEAA
jgi:hypothetical protein